MSGKGPSSKVKKASIQRKGITGSSCLGSLQGLQHRAQTIEWREKEDGTSHA